MEYIDFNLNEMIKVKLNEKGKNIYYHKNDYLGKKFLEEYPRKYPEVDKDGYTEFQMHDFMNIYGRHVLMGS